MRGGRCHDYPGPAGAPRFSPPRASRRPNFRGKRLCAGQKRDRGRVRAETARQTETALYYRELDARRRRQHPSRPACIYTPGTYIHINIYICELFHYIYVYNERVHCAYIYYIHVEPVCCSLTYICVPHLVVVVAGRAAAVPIVVPPTTLWREGAIFRVQTRAARTPPWPACTIRSFRHTHTHTFI